jgi:hypothetical protein
MGLFIAANSRRAASILGAVLYQPYLGHATRRAKALQCLLWTPVT